MMLLLGLLVGSLFSLKLSAAGYDTYHVVVYAGEHGTLTYTDAEGIVESGLPYKELEFKAGERFDPNAFTVELPEDSIYYFKGFQYSGTEDQVAGNMAVNEDITLVARYGIKGKQVAYTIHYVVSGSNQQLLEPVTLHGNVGDEVIVAYQYIEGYIPSAYNAHIAKLSENEADNIIVFVYTKVAVRDIYENGGTIPAATTTTVTETENRTGTGSPGNMEFSENENVPTDEPLEVIEINEPEIPMTNPDNQGEDSGTITDPTTTGIGWSTVVGMSIGIAGILVLLLFLFAKRKSKEE